MKNKIKTGFFALVILSMLYFCLKYPHDIGNGVVNSVNRCMTLIIPSMFIFMCITSIITNSGLHKILGIPFKFISRKFFRIPKEGFAIFLLSMIAGYPAGIKLVSDSFKNGDITNEQAKRMNCFCFSSGPAFISGTAAGVLYPKSNAGLLIFLSITLGNLITALISAQFAPKCKKSPDKKDFSVKGSCIITSVRSASNAIIQMCIMIVLFGGVCCILELSGIIQFISVNISSLTGINAQQIYDIIMTILEISNIINLPVMNIFLMPLITSLLSFGGLCVLIQVISISDKNFSVGLFLKSRIASALISGLSCKALIRFFYTDSVRDAISYNAISENKYAPLPTIFLVIMILIFLSTFKTPRKAKADD